VCGDKISVDAPEKGCAGSLKATLSGIVMLFGIIVVLKLLKRENTYEN
jgi:hypothetical protein